jgi:predicted dehydrogenase
MSIAVEARSSKPARKKVARPRLGFLGLGWTGRNRMEAIADSGMAEIVGAADVSLESMAQAALLCPNAEQCDCLESLLELDLDGIVIATPSALHAEQAIRALKSGVAVFCQKPLARTARETRRIIDAARVANKLLGVDLSYRCVNGVSAMKQLVQNCELGQIFAVDMLFHNADRPDKSWFYDPELSGGGCVIDLGIHLVDLALWCLDFPQVQNVTSRLFTEGELLQGSRKTVEDFAVARIDLQNHTTIQFSCSWKLPAGCDAIIRCSFYGTKGGVEFRNVNGSFHDFVVEHFTETKRERLANPPDNWGSRAVVDWTHKLAAGSGFDAEAERISDVAITLDQIYGR